jgi:hypothetical protein
MTMIFVGRDVDREGSYDIVKCKECGLERTVPPHTNPQQLKCNNCKGDDHETNVSRDR